MMSWSIVAVSTAQKFFLLPVWLFPNHLFDSTFFMPCFGQKYFNTRLYLDSYVLMIRSRCIWSLPGSFGSRITIEVNQRWSGFSFKSAIDMILWCKFHILSLKSSFLLLYWFPSGESKLWWWPKCRPDGEAVVDSFHFLNPCLYSCSGINLFILY